MPCAVCSQEAQAQVKLEYKFTEGDKLTYKSTTKTKQVLTLQGMEIETESDQVVVSSRKVGKRAPIRAHRSRTKSNRSAPSYRSPAVTT